MTILLIDTSKPEAWVVLARDGQVISERSWPADKTLGVLLLKHLQAMLDEAGIALTDIARVAVHRGPGHFSALRVGILTATLLAQEQTMDLVELTSDERSQLLVQAAQGHPVKNISPQYI